MRSLRNRRVSLGARLLVIATLPVLVLVGRTAAATPVPTPEFRYVPDELLVSFVAQPTGDDLETFAADYRLEPFHSIDVPPGGRDLFLFRILDGTDAAVKREAVVRDRRVCRAQLNALGELAATNPDPRPEPECEEVEKVGPPTPAPAPPTAAPLTTPPTSSAVPVEAVSAASPPGVLAGVLAAGVAVALFIAVGLVVRTRRSG